MPALLDAREALARAVLHVALAEHVRFTGSGTTLQAQNASLSEQRFSGSIVLSPGQGTWQVIPEGHGKKLTGGSRRFSPDASEITSLLQDIVVEDASVHRSGKSRYAYRLSVRMQSLSGASIRGLISIDAETFVPTEVHWNGTNISHGNGNYSFEVGARIDFPEAVQLSTNSGSIVSSSEDAIFDMFLQN